MCRVYFTLSEWGLISNSRAECSTEVSGKECQKALDTVLSDSGEWSSNAEGISAWIKITFPGFYHVNYSRIMQRFSSVEQFKDVQLIFDHNNTIEVSILLDKNHIPRILSRQLFTYHAEIQLSWTVQRCPTHIWPQQNYWGKYTTGTKSHSRHSITSNTHVPEHCSVFFQWCFGHLQVYTKEPPNPNFGVHQGVTKPTQSDFLTSTSSICLHPWSLFGHLLVTFWCVWIMQISTKTTPNLGHRLLYTKLYQM